MDIIVTTPKSEMAAAAQEAADARAAGGDTEYFRRFPCARDHSPRKVNAGDRVYYVEDGFVRGYAVVSHIEESQYPMRCVTTGREWSPGFYLFLRADSWRWIRPIKMRGFQGFRYVTTETAADGQEYILFKKYPKYTIPLGLPVYDAGGWLDPRPRSSENGPPLAPPETLWRDHAHPDA